jgi:hypothetical protein
MMGWADDLGEVFDEIIDALESSGDVVQSSGVGGLNDVQREQIGDALDKVAARIDQILDPDHSPNLRPWNAGAVDDLVDPSTLDEYARTTLSLAEEAQFEVAIRGNGSDGEYLGTLMRTIEHLLTRSSPHSYRSLAGLPTNPI